LKLFHRLHCEDKTDAFTEHQLVEAEVNEDELRNYEHFFQNLYELKLKTNARSAKTKSEINASQSQLRPAKRRHLRTSRREGIVINSIKPKLELFESAEVSSLSIKLEP
jgi:hypothetical protein